MIKSIKKIMRQVKKGFTLVEVIIVLVIIAILSAIIVPSLIGYIDKSRSTQYIMYARSAMTAAQTTLDEMFADGVPAYYLTNKGKTDETEAYYQKYQKSFRNLMESTEVYNAYFWYAVSLAVGEDEKTTTTSYSYRIDKAFYIYQVAEGGIFKMIYYDGSSWTELENEFSNINSAIRYLNITNRSSFLEPDSSISWRTRYIKDIYSTDVP